MKTTFFSIIIPLYNKEAHIVDTLNSVFAQTYVNYEIIVINDGSTDGSLTLVSEIKNKKLIIFDTKNQGVSAARNFGMKHAKGKYYAFLDADDLWFPNHLGELFHLIETIPNCGLYATNYTFNYGNFKVNTSFPTLPKTKTWSGIINDFFLASLTDRIAWTSAVAISKNTYHTVGGFNIQLTHGEDTEYWSRIALKHKVAFTKKVSAEYNLNSMNNTSEVNLKNQKKMDFSVFSVDEKHNVSLKKYNDRYRYEYALQYKISGDLKTSNYYLTNIDWNNVSLIKKLLIHLPTSILAKLWSFKQWLKTKQIDFYI